ncbi:hypothetical protein OJJOAM_002547 [Cupriavidus sp. H18C1]
MKRLAQGWNGAAAAELETPLSDTRRRARWGHLLLAGVLGVAHTQAFAPRDWWWLQLLALAGLAALLFDTRRARDAAALGYAFGLGWFLSGIWWLYISMHVYGEMPAWMAALAVLLFAGYLALYPALAAAAWHRAAAPRRFDPARRAGWFGLLAAPLAFGAAWGLAEWLRGVIFTGFPWLGSGYAHTDGPLAGYAPLLGVYGIGALAALCAAWLAALARVARPGSGGRRERRERRNRPDRRRASVPARCRRPCRRRRGQGLRSRSGWRSCSAPAGCWPAAPGPSRSARRCRCGCCRATCRRTSSSKRPASRARTRCTAT